MKNSNFKSNISKLENFHSLSSFFLQSAGRDLGLQNQRGLPSFSLVLATVKWFKFHLIFECKLYEDVRKQFVDLLNEYTTIPFQATTNTFCTLMSCLNGDLDVARIFCDFINNCFDIRKDYCNKTKENNNLIRPENSTTRYGRISKRPNRIDL